MVGWKCDVALINGWLVPEANESLPVVVRGWSTQWQAGHQLAARKLRKDRDTKPCFFCSDLFAAAVKKLRFLQSVEALQFL